MENNYILIKGAYNSHFQYYSQASQDKFIAHLFDFKKNGYVVDIGSEGPQNNSQFLASFLDWKAICIDMKPGDYSNRGKTRFYQLDATTINYVDLFKENDFPNVIDYVSIDADDMTNTVLKVLPLKDFVFSAITIEHDAYVDEDRRKPEQRKILTEAGYHLLCSDVSFLNPASPVANMYFEDWWIHPKSFDLEKYKFLECDKTDVNDIIARFNK
jgi:hypothetical protein